MHDNSTGKCILTGEENAQKAFLLELINFNHGPFKNQDLLLI